MDASNCDVASTNWTHWHGIPWQDAHQVVGRLQARIAKAAKAGEWRNVKCLQRLLTRSISAKALAVKRVTENRGRKTPGIDRQTWSTPDDKWQAVGTLHHKGYKPKPMRRVYIPKANGDRRHWDRTQDNKCPKFAYKLRTLSPISSTSTSTSTRPRLDSTRLDSTRRPRPRSVLDVVRGQFRMSLDICESLRDR
jgi:RNA-directed DNA polymerase